MNNLDYWADYCKEISNEELASYLDKQAIAAGREDMGRPDGMLAEAARRIRKIR